MPSKKRSRPDDENSAECPFTVRQRVPTKQERQDVERKSRREISEEDRRLEWRHQSSPFNPPGVTRGSAESLDLRYKILPTPRWTDMTRYNSFVLGKYKFYTDDFVYVANAESVKRQKSSEPATNGNSNGAGANGASDTGRRNPNHDWVARILEIRAQDEQHVYVRVYWMYWPDELPAGTTMGRKTLRGGRQAYHGKHELIASNHMDVINAVSVTQAAEVNHWIETDGEDEEFQRALYWRQAFNANTTTLSAAKAVCKCETPANPDNTLLCCSHPDCGQWMHDECLRHDTLMRVYERLGRTKPQVIDSVNGTKSRDGVDSSLRDVGEGEGRLKSKSQQEKPAMTSNETKEDIEDEKNGANDITSTQGMVSPPSTDTEKKETDLDPRLEHIKLPLLSVIPPTPDRPTPKKGAKKEPYRGLFEAKLRTDEAPPVLEIKDLRSNVEGGSKSWREQAFCLFCNRGID